MHYLIDGHNLIAKMPDIPMDDPNDEALLVLRLRSWVAGSRKRVVTVIFDRGLPGGRSRFLSGDQLNVIFAPEGRTADTLLINRIRKVNNAAEYTLVSGDQQVLGAARARRMKSISAEAFAKRLDNSNQKAAVVPEPVSPAEAEDPALSQEEVAEWLELFESAPRFKPKPPKPAADPQVKAGSASEDVREQKRPAAPRTVSDPATLKSGDGKLSSDEVDEWLKLFTQEKGE
jgi:predicted RNA-binding protein with PIN domain